MNEHESTESKFYDRDDIGDLKQKFLVGPEVVREIFEELCINANIDLYKRITRKDGTESKRLRPGLVGALILLSLATRKSKQLIDFETFQKVFELSENRAKSMISMARQVLLDRGIILYNMHGVGYRIANDRESVEEIVKSHARSIGYTKALNKKSYIGWQRFKKSENKEGDFFEIAKVMQDLEEERDIFLAANAHRIEGLSDEATILYESIRDQVKHLEEDRKTAEEIEITNCIQRMLNVDWQAR